MIKLTFSYFNLVLLVLLVNRPFGQPSLRLWLLQCKTTPQTLFLWTIYPLSWHLTCIPCICLPVCIRRNVSLGEVLHLYGKQNSPWKCWYPYQDPSPSHWDKMVATSLIIILQTRYKSHSLPFICQIGQFKPLLYPTTALEHTCSCQLSSVKWWLKPYYKYDHCYPLSHSPAQEFATSRKSLWISH
jgi:hypothetical protein